MILESRISAIVYAGPVENRIKILGPRGGIVRTHRMKPKTSVASSKDANLKVQTKERPDRAGIYRADESVKGQPYTTICISLPVAELQAMDAYRAKSKLSRSQLLRDAVKQLMSAASTVDADAKRWECAKPTSSVIR